jgi:translation initiation factor IF-2
MSQQTTIRKLAELVNTPVEKLLEQLAEAGMSFSGPDQVVTSIEKVKLLGFLKRAHGKAEPVAEVGEAPKKITLNRSRKQELTVGGGKNRSTVDVVVRKKVTLVKPAEAGSTDERSEILRKLEESKQRNLAEQEKLAADDRRRAETIEAARREAAEAARLKAEEEAKAKAADASVLVADDDEKAVRKPATTHGHGHPKPAPARAPEPARGTPAHKTRGSHAMVTTVEDDDRTNRFAGQMHLSASDRARRSTSARGKPKPRRQSEQARSGSGFTRPTAPIVREVAIGETITVADLAQKMALKGGDVVKALFKMGVLASI